MARGTLSGSTFTADPNQGATYSYNASNGKLASVTFGLQDNQGRNLPLAYAYTYSAAGRVMSKTMTWQMYDPNFPSPIPVAMEALYQWDNQGKQASLTYPQANWNGQARPPVRLSILISTT